MDSNEDDFDFIEYLRGIKSVIIVILCVVVAITLLLLFDHFRTSERPKKNWMEYSKPD